MFDRHQQEELAPSGPHFGDVDVEVADREGWVVNHKRIYRLYNEEGLSIRAKLPRRKRAWRYRAGRPQAACRAMYMA